MGDKPLGGKVLKERNTRMCVYLDQNKPIKGGFSKLIRRVVINIRYIRLKLVLNLIYELLLYVHENY